MSRFSRADVVFKKELFEHLRDRRTLASIAMPALIGPVLIWFMFQQMASNITAAQDITIPVIGAEYAPEFVDWLAQNDRVEVSTATGDPAEQVAAGELDLVLSIDEDFGRRFEQSRPARVKLYFDQSNQKSQPKLRRVRGLVNAYSRAIASLRLVARGVSPGVSQPIALQDVEVSSAQRLTARLISFVPMFLLIAAFAGGLAAAIDSTAGERERGSLEPLLANPVSTDALALGKWLAATGLACGALVLSSVAMVAVFGNLPLFELGVQLRIGVPEIVALGITVLPIAALAPALEILIATFARSIKEAQAQTSYLMMVPMAPAMAIAIMGIKTAPWMSLVPLLAQTRLIHETLAGEMPAAWEFAVAGISAVFTALICVQIVARLLRREKVVFGR